MENKNTENKHVKAICPVCGHDKFTTPIIITGRIVPLTAKIQMSPKMNGVINAPITFCDRCGVIFNFAHLQKIAMLEAKRLKEQDDAEKNKKDS